MSGHKLYVNVQIKYLETIKILSFQKFFGLRITLLFLYIDVMPEHGRYEISTYP